MLAGATSALEALLYSPSTLGPAVAYRIFHSLKISSLLLSARAALLSWGSCAQIRLSLGQSPVCARHSALRFQRAGGVGGHLGFCLLQCSKFSDVFDRLGGSALARKVCLSLPFNVRVYVTCFHFFRPLGVLLLPL